MILAKPFPLFCYLLTLHLFYSLILSYKLASKKAHPQQLTDKLIELRVKHLFYCNQNAHLLL